MSTEQPKTPGECHYLPKSVWEKAEKIESYVTERECRLLWSAAMLEHLGSEEFFTPTVVEVGSWLGRSSVILGHAINKVLGTLVAVDTWQDCDLAPGVDFYPRWRANMIEAGVSDRAWDDSEDRERGLYLRWPVGDHIGVCRMPSIVAARLWPHSQPFSHDARGMSGIELCFIDADHSYESVRQDFEAWYPHMSPEGLIVLHDVNCGHPGPKRLLAELGKRFRTRAVDNIGVVLMDRCPVFPTIAGERLTDEDRIFKLEE